MTSTKKKRSGQTSITLKVAIISLFLLAIVFNIYALFFEEISKHIGFEVASVGLVSLLIEGAPQINITHPLNTTYNFAVAEPLILDLNATSDVPIDTWQYRLYDDKHNEWIGDWTVFPQNTTFTPVRWGNIIYAKATTPAGRTGEDNESFFVFAPNSAPIIYNLNSTIQICEDESLFYTFYAIDSDEDENPSGLLVHNIQPTHNRFFLKMDSWYRAMFNYSIFSGTMIKTVDISVNEGSRTYSSNISVNDGEFLDYRVVDIAVIEKNHVPDVSNISVRTIWNQGANSTLYEEIDANDTEYELGYGNLTFNISIFHSNGTPVDLFDINYTNDKGAINFTADNSTPLGVYDVTFCVNDTGLTSAHANISQVCNQTGLSMADCEYFELTVTNSNRAPTIVDYYPLNLSFNASGTDNLYFNITKYDPDGTIPDAYWFVDNVFKEYDEGSLFDEFNYVFGCDVLGFHNITVNITDGLLNDTLTWTVKVDPVLCPAPGGGGGGGGGGGAPVCSSKWGCDGWAICQNAKISLENGLLSGEDYRIIKETCDLQELNDGFCGFQIRDCKDVNQCFLASLSRPEEVQQCYYTENPSCEDGIKNCHNGGCELLVDCSGPCKPCPTCTDKIKNQGEEGIDCGGPCPWRCKAAVPFLKRKEIIYGFLILLLLLIIFIIVKLMRVLRYQKTLGEQRRFNIKV